MDVKFLAGNNGIIVERLGIPVNFDIPQQIIHVPKPFISS